MTRPNVVVFLLSAILAVSCDDEYPVDYNQCHCQDNGIGGWENPKDTTGVNQKGTTGGFAVSLDDWTDSYADNIKL